MSLGRATGSSHSEVVTSSTARLFVAKMLHASAGLLALLISPVPPGHVSPHLRAAGPFMCAPPLVATEIEGMAYRQLQQLCCDDV